MSQVDGNLATLAAQGLRAAPSAYVILVGPWLVLVALLFVADLRAPGGGAFQATLLVAAVALAWSVWLRGFRVRINSTTLEYRDGLYRTQVCSLGEIRRVVHGWVEFKSVGRRVSAPRLVVELMGGSSIVINSKVFARESLREMERVLGDGNPSAT